MCRRAFTDPFRYIPSEEAVKASKEVISFIDRHFRKHFSEGKMLGVLIVRTGGGTADGSIADADSLVHPLGDGTGFIAAFSGTVDGKGTLPYFVPPIYDITVPGGYFREKEAQIIQINRKIESVTESAGYLAARKAYTDALACKEKEVERFRTKIAESRRLRNEKRSSLGPSDSEAMAALERESQFEKAELKRLVRRHEEAVSGAKGRLDAFTEELSALKAQRQEMSDSLQKWIFRQYHVKSASGETADILSIFSRQDITPPGGTGDCAAPKLLQYAFTHGLEPLSMGEFWYGAPPSSSVRAHGHFYPSCQHKCGPLLGFMLRGMALEKAVRPSGRKSWSKTVPGIIYEDDSIIAAVKPSGMLSGPGRNGERSLAEYLEDHLRDTAGPSGKIFMVHRLDMDTSGIILYARTAVAQCALQRQFEEGTVRKTYLATLCPPAYPSSLPLKEGDKGVIELPLCPAYEERPRQKADRLHGKPATTHYEVLRVLRNGETEIAFHPLTGRTHQLRIHSAHKDGLGRPIKGDLLYGGCLTGSDAPLHLHASSITFTHPATGEEMTFFSGIQEDV